MRHINIYFKTLVAIFFLFTVLFPTPAYATGPGYLLAGLAILAFLVVIANVLKLVALYFIESLKTAKVTFGKFLGVSITEIALVLFAYIPIICFFMILELLNFDILRHKFEYALEPYSIYVYAVSFWLFAILPNLLILKEKGQSVRSLISQPKKVLYALLLALMSPLFIVIYDRTIGFP